MSCNPRLLPRHRHHLPHAAAPICTEEETGGGAGGDKMSFVTPSVFIDASLLPPVLCATVVQSPCLLTMSGTDTLRLELVEEVMEVGDGQAI
jgi:hypothetical protein